jgi:multiple sugar transport system permease protein
MVTQKVMNYRPRNYKKYIKSTLLLILLIIFLLFFLFPIYWIIISSFKNNVDIFAYPPKFLLFKPVLDNFKTIFQGDLSLPKNIFHSLQTSVLSVLFSSILAIPAGYAFARFRFRRKGLLSFWVLSLIVLPPVIVLLPWLRVFNILKIYDTLLGLVIIYSTFNIPFIIWLSQGFFKEIPREIEEAAEVDGSTKLGLLWRITLPLAMPGLSAVLILSTVFTWNEYLFAFILTGQRAMTGPVTLTNYISLHQIAWGQFSAGGVLIMLPPLIFVTIIQKYIIRGLTFGAIKE